MLCMADPPHSGLACNRRCNCKFNCDELPLHGLPLSTPHGRDSSARVGPRARRGSVLASPSANLSSAAAPPAPLRACARRARARPRHARHLAPGRWGSAAPAAASATPCHDSVTTSRCCGAMLIG